MTETRMPIRLARSKAGHDKGKCYVVVREESDDVWLADGTSRTAAHPKRKNRKHIQIINRIPAHVLAVFTTWNPPSDAEIKRALKLYSPANEQQEEE